MPRSRKNRGETRHGDHVRIDAHVSSNDPADKSVDLRGETGRVIGANPRYQDANGETRLSVILDNGALVSVPERALRRG